MPESLVTTPLSRISLSVRKWNADIRAYQVHHIHHVLYVSEPVRLTNDQLDFVVRCLDAGIAYA